MSSSPPKDLRQNCRHGRALGRSRDIPVAVALRMDDARAVTIPGGDAPFRTPIGYKDLAGLRAGRISWALGKCNLGKGGRYWRTRAHNRGDVAPEAALTKRGIRPSGPAAMCTASGWRNRGMQRWLAPRSVAGARIRTAPCRIEYPRPASPGDLDLARAVGELASRYHAVLLANHGPVVAGKTLDDAVYATEEHEENCEAVSCTEGNGNPSTDPRPRRRSP